MNLHNNIEQRTPEWHAIRKGSIGGSGVKKAFAKNNLPYLDELIAERMVEHVEESFVSADMQRGIDLEPFAINEAEQLTGHRFAFNGLVTNDKFKSCHLSPDGIDLESKVGIEVKCPNSKKHIEYIRTNRIPADYKQQILHYFAIADEINTMLFVSYDPRVTSRPIHIIEVTREEWAEEISEYETELLKFILKVEKEFNKIIDNF